MFVFFLQPDPEEEEFRYVPDVMLLELQSQMEDLEMEKDSKKKK